MPTNAPGHLLPLANGWSLWKDFCVRGAGFPAEDVLRLASRELASAVDAWLELEERIRELRQTLIATLDRERQGLPPDEARALNGAIKRLARGGLPQELQAGDEARTRFEALRSSLAELEAARARLDALFERESTRLGEVLRAQARDSRFREALVWQNRAALHSAIEPLLRSPPDERGAKVRTREQLVANYLQRYTVKNDSIGFFGPLGWGTFSEEGPSVMARPGPSLIEGRRVSLDFWAIEALAQKFSKMPGIRPWLAPRLMAYARIEGRTLHMPLGSDELSPTVLRLLSLCNGERLAREIAPPVIAEGLFTSEADVYAALEEQRSRGVLVWELELPTLALGRERVLRQLLERVGDEAARSTALAQLSELEEAREAVVRAAGDPDALDRALGEVESRFSRLTSMDATRNAGMTYGGRTMIYEDCRRGLSVTFGPELLDRIRRPLSLLMLGGRWYSHQLGRRCHEALLGVFRSLCEGLGTDTVEGVLFWPAAAELFPENGKHPAFAEPLVADYPARWARVFGLPQAQGQRVVELTSDAIEPLVRELFAAPHPGWPTSRYHSPDLMISARSLEALQRGDYQVVLGELHFAVNSLEQEFFMDSHPEPARLRGAIAEDVGPRFIPAVMKTDLYSGRGVTPLSDHPEDVVFEFGASRSWRPRSQVVALSDLVMRVVDGRLMSCTRDGSRCWDVMQVAQIILPAIMFPLLPPMPYVPRVTLDGLVVAREAWRFQVAELPFVQAPTTVERFIGVRRWARDRGLPRFLFFKASSERKPSYLDLESPHAVDNFLRMLQGSQSVFVSEMLPAIDHTWLPDAEGHTYTSEFRIVAVDPETWRPD
ncbi:MAG TPA: lantibiotic dehydratase [Archangium sp.]|uniref:lantibiotic dehydratase n=1 Tax=Archangium sp. TaxID=1872627 RepID=UPI002E3310EA|nr:lantibiotic dehydratase [Archangium sp.]HEX5753897.1 lantibiotic dehydratase [Archangium sp.]